MSNRFFPQRMVLLVKRALAGLLIFGFLSGISPISAAIITRNSQSSKSFDSAISPDAFALDRPAEDQELITNGSFENWAQGWSAQSVEFTSITSHTPLYSALFNGDGESRLSQAVDVPPADAVYVTYFYRYVNNDPQCVWEGQFEFTLTYTFEDGTSGSDGFVDSLCGDVSDTNGWESVYWPISPGVRSVTVEFREWASINSYTPSVVFIDDVSIMAQGVEPLDSDGDGLSDEDEISDGICTDPINPDSDDDGVLDGADVDPCSPVWIGVIPGPGGCPRSLEQITITMDNQDPGSGESLLDGWIGGTDLAPHMKFVFCRTNGLAFRHWEVDDDSYPLGSYAYMVLKLDNRCPNGSKWFTRTFDNEDSGKPANKTTGNIYPNSQDKNTHLHFCFFEGRVTGGNPSDSMSAFPDLGFEYGVFARRNFLGSLERGLIYTDDENTNNSNGYGYDPGLTTNEVAAIHQIISGIRDTYIELAKVFTPPPPPPVCGDLEYCAANPRPIDVSVYLDATPLGGEYYKEAAGYFADAIYEMSNGVNKVRQVYFYYSRWQLGWTQVWWSSDAGRANADINGWWIGGHVYMFEEASSVDEGYVLGHEFGHYFYGLLDEYREQLDCTDYQYSAQCDDDPVVPSVMTDQYRAAWENLLDWLNFSVEANNTKKNAQDRFYGAGGWTTLARPTTGDPRKEMITAWAGFCDGSWWYEKVNKGLCWQRDSFTARTWLPELGPVRPSGSSLPSIEIDSVDSDFDNRPDVTASRAAARSLLDVQFFHAPQNIGGGNSGVNLPQPGSLAIELPLVGSEDVTIPIFPDTSNINVVAYTDPPVNPGALVLELRDPNGTLSATGTSSGSVDKESSSSVQIVDPEAGSWTLTVQVSEAPVNVDIYFETTVSNPDAVFTAQVGSPQGYVVPYPNPLIVGASVKQGQPIAGAGISVQAFGPDDQPVNITLRDDGIPPDAIAQDGTYIGWLDYTESGDYKVMVAFDNHQGNAVFTSKGMADGGSGTEPVGSNFLSTDTAIFTVSDVQADDHGNTPPEATDLTMDNKDVPGRIDYAQDRDVFRIQPATDQEVTVRVSGLGMDMEPHIRALGPDGTSVIQEVDHDSGEGVYPYLLFQAQAGQPYYIEIAHRNPGAAKGTYYISAGERLHSEIAFPVPSRGPALYLPVVVRSASTPAVVSIRNGSFEAGPDGSWTEYSRQGADLIVSGADLPIAPHSGNRAVWLGGLNDEISYIQQSVTVPASTPFLTYWHWIASEDECGYDFGGVLVNGQVVDQYDLCATSNTGGWQQHSVNLTAYIGTTASVQIRAETDSSVNSNLFVDDVAFQATAVGVAVRASSISVEQAMEKPAVGSVTGEQTRSERMFSSTSTTKQDIIR